MIEEKERKSVVALGTVNVERIVKTENIIAVTSKVFIFLQLTYLKKFNFLLFYRSKDRRDKHDKDNSERDDKVHIKQEPVDG